jgi:parvulin-like peptidyl-prolyl isomerase
MSNLQRSLTRGWVSTSARWRRALHEQWPRSIYLLLQIRSSCASLDFLKRKTHRFSWYCWGIGGALILLVVIVAQYQMGVFTAPRRPLDPNTVVAVFAGKPITHHQMETGGLSHAQALFSAGQSGALRRRSFDLALYDVLNQIEIDKQIDQEIATHKNHTREQAFNAIVARAAPLRPFTKDEARAFYQSHPELFARSGPRIHVREIVVGNQDLADQLGRRLQAKESFTHLASAYSVDPPQYRQQGGDLGWVGENQMPMEWSSVVFGLRTGQTSPVFQVGQQYYIVQVLEGPRYDVAPFDAVSSSVVEQGSKYDQKCRMLVWLTGLILHDHLEVRIHSYVQPIGTAMVDLRQHPDQLLPYNLG